MSMFFAGVFGIAAFAVAGLVLLVCYEQRGKRGLFYSTLVLLATIVATYEAQLLFSSERFLVSGLLAGLAILAWLVFVLYSWTN